ncbi:MAG: nucleoside hydrolase [Bacteroidales bacterium]|jgi:pyrimidine-specific ribonucleoside hydrolase|nr:nucleoside hydrolase [Bacteroidales bacterium]
MNRFFLFIATILFSLFLSGNVFSHSFAKYHIVIDTDGGIDDFRAITYFMASKDFNINCISTVDGVLTPNRSANYFSQILSIYHHEGIPIGEGKETKAPKQYSNHALALWEKFFQKLITKKFPDATNLLYNSIINNNNRTIIIALGPLSNITELIKTHEDIIQKIDYILWYSDYDKNPLGYNYQADTVAFNFLIKKNILFKLVNAKGLQLSENFLNDCNEIKSIYSETMVRFFKPTQEKQYVWDDFLPLYLLYPLEFDEIFVSNNLTKISLKKETYFEYLITTILNSDKKDINVIFNTIPTSGFMLQKDINSVVDSLIEKHGYTEYKLCCLTSEIHSHLGIYSIIGAKLGLRILEYLHTGLDEIRIESHAGSEPPISCFNDGLQVGTGATLGYGTFSVIKISQAKTEVVVSYNNRKYLFKLKNNIDNEISNKTDDLIKLYGYNTDMYWLKLRELAIEYWLELNRFEIFEITEII